MPRKSRDSQRDDRIGYEHILIRLKRNSTLFQEDEYKREYMRRLKVACLASEVRLHAFCLFDDHFHLVVKGRTAQISCAIRNTHAVFARKYFHDHPENNGIPIFRDRFRSERLENEEDLLKTVRAIHQEPVRRGLSERMEDYRWSSYRLFMLRSSEIIDTAVILDSLHFAGGFRDYMQRDMLSEGYPILEELPEKFGRTDQEAEEIFERYLDGADMDEFRGWSDEIKKDYVRLVKRKEDISIMQLCRITGLTRGIIQRL